MNLRDWKSITSDFAQACEYAGLYTLEDLATASDQVLRHIGPHAAIYSRKAAEWVKRAAPVSEPPRAITANVWAATFDPKAQVRADLQRVMADHALAREYRDTAEANEHGRIDAILAELQAKIDSLNAELEPAKPLAPAHAPLRHQPEPVEAPAEAGPAEAPARQKKPISEDAREKMRQAGKRGAAIRLANLAAAKAAADAVQSAG